MFEAWALAGHAAGSPVGKAVNRLDERNGGAPGGLSRVVLRARADMTMCEAVEELGRMSRRAAAVGCRRLIIDLSAVVRADTKLIACLVGIYRLARSARMALEFRISAVVANVASVCRLERLFEAARASA